MAVKANIKFTQGANTDVPGRSVFGHVADGAVSLSNGDNTGIKSWEWSMDDVPYLSAVPKGSLGTASTAAFTPDSPSVRHCFKVTLRVIGFDGSTDEQTRVFGCLDTNNLCVPPFKATDEMLNFSGGKRGYAQMWDELIDFALTGGGGGGLLTIVPEDLMGSGSPLDPLGTTNALLVRITDSSNVTVSFPTTLIAGQIYALIVWNDTDGASGFLSWSANYRFDTTPNGTFAAHTANTRWMYYNGSKLIQVGGSSGAIGTGGGG
jgi:hypothetical protein